MSDRATWALAMAVVRDLDGLAGDELTGALGERCPAGSPLRHAVELILREREDESAGLWPEIDELMGIASDAVDAAALPVVPGVDLVGLIGRGGSGDVYLGRQRSPAREVAVKVLRSGLGTRRARERFELEATVLGSIAHPAVASVFLVTEAQLPGGAMAPCIVMERVEGGPLSGTPAMSASAAAGLMARIARGVHAAHQRGVIHRDLKPANIMIRPDGEPKILDFGVAMLRDGAPGSAPSTLTGELLGTPGYMSPEQLGAGGGGVDVRSDIYALGLIFFALVAGRSAVEVTTPSSMSALAVVLRGELPRLESSRDANAVYRKATALEPDRRYDSAAAMAEDLERLASGRAVSARTPSVPELLWLSARRRPLTFGLGAAAAAAVLALTAAASAGFMIASQQRDRSRLAERRAVESSAFLREMLASPDPEADGADVRLADLLDRWGVLVNERASDDPLVRMDLHRTLGWTYAALSRHEQAVAHLRTAEAIALAELPHGGDEVLQLQTNLGSSLVYLADTDAAVALMESVVSRCGPESEASAETAIAAMNGLAEAVRYAGDVDRARVVFEAAARRAEAELGDGHEQTQAVISGLGRVCLDTLLAAEARGHFERLLSIYEGEGSRGTPKWLIARGNHATALAYEGEHERAIEGFEEVLRLSGPLLGDLHYTPRMSRQMLPSSYAAVGRNDDALSMSERTIRDAEAVSGLNHPDTLTAVNNHANILMSLGRFADALPHTERVCQGMIATLGQDHPHALVGMRTHASALEGVGRLAEADDLYARALEVQRRVHGEDDFGTLVAKNNLAFLRDKTGSHAEAVTLMREVLASCERVGGYPAGAVAVFTKNLGQFLIGGGSLDEAEAVLLRAIELDPGNDANVAKSRAQLDRLAALRGAPSP